MLKALGPISRSRPAAWRLLPGGDRGDPYGAGYGMVWTVDRRANWSPRERVWKLGRHPLHDSAQPFAACRARPSPALGLGCSPVFAWWVDPVWHPRSLPLDTCAHAREHHLSSERFYLRLT